MAGALLRPSSFEEGGGLVSDVDVRITDVRFVEWDYDGKNPTNVLALRVTMENLDEEDESKRQFVQHFSAGDLKFFVPSEDGLEAVPVGKKEYLNSNTNAAQFLSSIVAAGFPEERLESQVSVFEGMVCHVERKAQPKRTGLMNQASETGGRDKTILLVTEIKKFPWDTKTVGNGAKKAAPKAAAAAPAAAPKAPAASAPVSGVDDTELQGIIMEKIAEAPLKKGAITPLVFSKITDPKAKPAAAKRAFSDDFLNAGVEAGLWAYDGVNVSLAE